MTRLYVLYEHAAGYAIFKVQEFEEVGMFLPQLEGSISDLGRFNSIVKLVGFSPFKTALAALENINAVSEGLVTDDLKDFIDVTVPKGSKRNKITVGVLDAKLGAAIAEAMEVQCTHIGAVPEVIRGIRKHFHDLVQGFTEQSSSVAQLGLGHSYSRAKVKFNVHRVDNMIIQSIALLDQLDKDINTFSMRIREWYSYHFPELVRIVPDNYTYAKLAKFIKNHKTLSDESLGGLEEITMDSGKAQAIIEASKSSMGMEISDIDMINIEMFASKVVSLADYRKKLSEYLKTKMKDVAPNLATLIGDQVGARLISKAGSLTNLAKAPASTVQILGAEKALFRALKTRGNTPKYGLLYNSSFIGRANAKNKGRISRFLANKCSIASRIDCFADDQSNVFGEKLKEQVEERLAFYENGTVPKKNIEVMKEAAEAQAQVLKARKKKNKKLKSKVSLSESVVKEEVKDEIEEETEVPKKNKKKKQIKEENGTSDHTFNESSVIEDEAEMPIKKKKKKKQIREEDGTSDYTFNESSVMEDEAETSIKKKKKKQKQVIKQEA